MVCLKRHPFLYCLANMVLGSTPQSLGRAIAQPNENSHSHFSSFFSTVCITVSRLLSEMPWASGWLQGVLAFHGVLGQSIGRPCGLGQEIRSKDDTTTHKTGGFLFNLLLALL
jgi:hypothetical protein